MVAGITSTTPTTPSSITAADAKTLNQNFDQFLMLLVTQLKNQDPLSPMDSAQFTNQLVSFSGVEQQIKMNDNLKQLVNLTKTGQTTLGLSYIGLNVDINDDNFEYAGTGAVSTLYDLPSDASVATISVLDQGGNVIYSQPGELSSGKHSFVWNGLNNDGVQTPAGIYEVRIGALDIAQKSMTAGTVVPGFVSGISTADDGSINLIIGKMRPKTIPLSAVTQASL